MKKLPALRIPKPRVPQGLKLQTWWLGLPRFYKEAIKDAYETTTKAILKAEAERTAARLAMMIQAQNAWQAANPGKAATYEEMTKLWEKALKP